MGARSDDSQPSGLEPTQIAANDATLPASSASESAVAVMAAGVSEDDLHPGDYLGRYRIEHLVGRGGMGEVYAAHDPQLDRRIAIKVLTATYRNAEAAARLVREAQALAKLDHPNVVAIHDAGEVDGRVFLAMGFVEGLTLGEHLARRRLPWSEIVALFVAAGRGLAAAHGAGLVHRDFKPGNVLVDRQGRVAVTDFGLARAAAELSAPLDSAYALQTPDPADRHHSHNSLDSNMTQAGALIGTPAYMSPEQHAGERGSSRSDQFSFCIALWEALFGRHPFVPAGHDRVTSPFEYTHLITEGVLSVPASGHPVSRRVLAALVRGLDRAPDRRWPTMGELLDQLEPPPASYRTAVVSLAAVATVGVGVAIWLAVRPHPQGRTCAIEAADRLATAWTPAQAEAIGARFVASGRSYAAAMASEATAGLDRYASRWTQLASEGCTAGASGDPAARDLAARRVTCLDQRLTALRTVVGQLAAEGRAELVDNAAAIVAGLPDLGDCADARTLAAGGGPPPDVADKLPALQARLAEIRVLVDAGLFRDAMSPAEALVQDADALGWPTLRVGAHQVLGEARLGMWMPTSADELLRAATIATEARLDREAARAYMLAVVAAGSARKKETVATLAPIARAVATATGDPLLVARAKLAEGRALSRTGQYVQAEALCREAEAVIADQPGATRADRGEPRKCLIETLIPLDKRTEARQVLEAALQEVRDQAGPDHPAVADLETTLAGFVREEGKVDEARAMVERGLALRERIYGKDHSRVAESLIALADYVQEPDQRRAMFDRALAIAEDPIRGGPRGRSVAAQIHRRLALAAGAAGDDAGTRAHFQRELELLEDYAGPESLEVAILLVNFGQYTTRWDFDGGLAMLRRSIAILERLRDPRVTIARGAIGVILVNGKKWREALPILEKNVADADPDRIPPENYGQMHFHLAIALIETKGDRTRAAKLADQAREAFVRAGPDGLDQLKRLAAWRKKIRL